MSEKAPRGKAVCKNCLVQKWASEFGLNSVKDILNLDSITCLYCKLYKDTKDRLEILENRVGRVENHFKVVRDEVGKSVKAEIVKIRSNISKEKTYAENLSCSADIKNISSIPEFMVVSNKKTVSGKVKPEQELEVSNSFSPLDTIVETETLLVGDFTTENQEQYFVQKNKKRKVYKKGKANIENIIGSVQELKLKDDNSVLIVSSGSAELELERGNLKVRQTIDKLNKLASTINSKTPNGIMVGILPMRPLSFYQIGRVRFINQKAREICRNKNIKFVDFWPIFYGNGEYYHKDGIHLNRLGQKKLGDLLSLNVLNMLEKNRYNSLNSKKPESGNELELEIVNAT